MGCRSSQPVGQPEPLNELSGQSAHGITVASEDAHDAVFVAEGSCTPPRVHSSSTPGSRALTLLESRRSLPGACSKDMAAASAAAVACKDKGMPLKDVVNMTVISKDWGTASYPGLKLPDPNEGLAAYSLHDIVFTLRNDVNLKARQAEFHSELRSPQKRMSSVTGVYDFAQRLVNSTSRSSHAGANVQGSDGRWDTDKFAAELVGHSALASFLELCLVDGFVLDLSGRPSKTSARLQELKAEVISSAPSTLLRCKGYLTDVRGSPQLTKIVVFFNDRENRSYTPADGFRWGLAKVILHAMGNYVVQCFHVAVHLFSHCVVAASQRSLPEGSLLRGMMDPQTVLVTNTMLETATILQNDKNSVWRGTVWNTNLDEVRSVCAQIARYFLDADPLEALGFKKGAPASRPSWWAGGAARFVGPITKFSKQLSQAVLEEHGSNAYLALLQEELVKVGILRLSTHSDAPLQSEDRFAMYYRNVLFFQSIYHTHMYAARECLTPLGLPQTERLLSILKAPMPSFITTRQAIDAALFFEGVDVKPFVAWTSALYGMTRGVDDAPELGDGPYFNSAGMEDAIGTFQSELNKAREEVHDAFKDNRCGFVPAYFYPKGVSKPAGYGITQTTYI
eukprot:TRINITY_DN27167_c0_g1_i1.p1 TRINITY_DN27167_c0_g1~~TRINITY_DN27167_c0_g1_i1.p1  ORF type:complete len:623 (-),score=70.03 TRINITY_DN27167_c0_g1_i1:438-2306(-)